MVNDFMEFMEFLEFLDFIDFIDHLDDLNDRLSRERVPRITLRDIENPLERYSQEEYVQLFRFRRETIRDVLLSLVYPNNTDVNNRGLPISPMIKLCTALHFYATGNFQRVCADFSNISQASCCRIINEVSELLGRSLGSYIKFPTTEAEKAAVKRKFLEIGGFPGVMGCVDATHIEIKSPGGANAAVFRNRKGFISLNVQVVVGPSLNIFDIVIRWPGSVHDSTIFNRSTVSKRFESQQLTGILLGDSEYKQTKYLFTPLDNAQTPPGQRYNTAHDRTRNLVERALEVWKGRFRCLGGTLQCHTRNAGRIIAATAILHNIAQDVGEDIPDGPSPHNVNDVPAQPIVERRREKVIKNAFIRRHFT